MFEKVKEFMEKPVTWGASIKLMAYTYAIAGVCISGVKLYEYWQGLGYDRLFKNLNNTAFNAVFGNNEEETEEEG